MAFDAARLADALARLDPAWASASCCVALSGGVDSAVLLHALQSLAAGGRGAALRAVHVDHGLQPQSPAWAAHCRAFCARLAVPFELLHATLPAAAGASVEALAREARYAALAANLRPGEWLLTAHHRDDQLETVLIQLLRGAGVAGLAAMPPSAAFGAGRHLRPLLDVGRAEIAAYAEAHALPVLRDPMNEATRFDRGFLRAEILPRLRQRWPGAAETVARSARHLGEAARLLAELGGADLAVVADGRRLSIERLQALSRDRQSNLLRHWLRTLGLRPPPSARLAAALDQLLPARADAQPLVRWPEGEIRRYRGRLYAMRPLGEVARLTARLADRGGAAVELGGGCGRFRLVPDAPGGLLAALPAPLELRFRGGGESLRPAPGRPRKRLKDLCQEAGVVPWMRGRLPLLHAGGRLVAVADLWVESEFRAPPGAAGLHPQWEGRPDLF